MALEGARGWEQVPHLGRIKLYTFEIHTRFRYLIHQLTPVRHVAFIKIFEPWTFVTLFTSFLVPIPRESRSGTTTQTPELQKGPTRSQEGREGETVETHQAVSTVDEEFFSTVPLSSVDGKAKAFHLDVVLTSGQKNRSSWAVGIGRSLADEGAEVNSIDYSVI